MADDKEIASRDDGLAEAMASIPNEPLDTPDNTPIKSGQGHSGERQVEEKPPAAEPAGPRHDERGRFAPRAEDAPAAPEEEREGGQIPSWRLREIREERDRMNARAEAAEQRAAAYEQQWRAMQQQAWEAQQQQQFQPPDPMSDPQAYHQFWQSELDRRQHEWSEREINRYVQHTFETEEEKDPEGFKKAYAAILEVAKGKPQLADEVRRSPNPGKALMGWHRQHTVMTEIGNDPDGWRKSERERLRKDPDFRKEMWAEMEAEARGNGRSFESNVSNLPSVNRAPGGAGRQELGSLGGSDREIFESLTRKR